MQFGRQELGLANARYGQDLPNREQHKVALLAKFNNKHREGPWANDGARCTKRPAWNNQQSQTDEQGERLKRPL
jgi:hypothetical protein